MAKLDDRPIDHGLAALRGKDEAVLVDWWKERLGLIAAIPQDVARVGALTPTLRELVRVTDDAERRKLTRARIVAFSQLPQEQRQTIMAARKAAWSVDKDVLQRDQTLVDELLPSLDPNVRAAYPSP